MDWWNVTVFGIVPVLAVLCLFFFKRKFLWSAPIISTILAAVITLIAKPTILEDREATSMFVGIVLPMHFVITLILTVIAYGVSFVLKRRHKN